MEVDKLELKVTLPNVDPLIVTSLDSALARPFKKIFDKGKPIGTLNYVFYGYDMRPTYIIGTLVKTIGKRILFFPALNSRSLVWHTWNNNSVDTKKINPCVDHFSFENTGKWHVTAYDKEGKKKIVIPKINAPEISKGLRFWFSLSVKNEDYLEKTPSELIMNYPLPSTDSDRRIHNALNARKEAEFHIISLNKPNGTEGLLYPSEKEFLNFEFYIDFEENPQYGKLRQVVAPFGHPALKSKIFREKDTPTREHKVKLPEFKGVVWVRASKLVGLLSDRCIITCLEKFPYSKL